MKKQPLDAQALQKPFTYRVLHTKSDWWRQGAKGHRYSKVCASPSIGKTAPRSEYLAIALKESEFADIRKS